MLCIIHKSEARFIKAGVSKKTGKPYNGFWACQTEGCRGPFFESVDVGFEVGSINSPKPTYKSIPQEQKTDWVKLGRTKALCGMVNGMLAAGHKPNDIKLPELLSLLRGIEQAAGEPQKAPTPLQPDITVEYGDEDVPF